MSKDLTEVKSEWIDEAKHKVGNWLPHLKMPDFTTDELHNLIGEPPVRNYWGCLMHQLQDDGLIEQAGFRRSTRPSANGRVIRVWRLK